MVFSGWLLHTCACSLSIQASWATLWCETSITLPESTSSTLLILYSTNSHSCFLILVCCPCPVLYLNVYFEMRFKPWPRWHSPKHWRSAPNPTQGAGILLSKQTCFPQWPLCWVANISPFSCYRCGGDSAAPISQSLGPPGCTVPMSALSPAMNDCNNEIFQYFPQFG